ncbi:DUF1129 family protein [Alkalihalobacillus oceani]|uniref:DUF1129 family protein n=1 Tax=Halalkalibacter oceani TaxID=1653776 RepID=UPI00203D86DF|nr:DUF1129 family protein [Halalkalibacter oceani]MCM3762474.1 DUF1129 family protein [Halalkalibacter oceani]
MRVKELIEENNRKRELLDKENENYYEGLLLYIRTSFNKSEQETEEILMEVLDHLLEAQEEGRTAEEVFGDDPKAYAEEIVGELPTAMPKEIVKILSMMGLIFLGVFSFSTGLLATILSYGFDMGDTIYQFYLGSLAVRVAGSILVAYLLVEGALRYIRWSAFRSINRKKEFILLFLLGGGASGLAIAGLYLMPSFGVPFEFPVYWLIPIGVVLYGAGKWVGKK